MASIVTPAHLPEPRNTRSHPLIQSIYLTILVDFFNQHRPWSDQAHLPAQNIPELRQLVQAERSQKATNTGDTGIPAQFLVRLPLRLQIGVALQELGQQPLRVEVHRPKFPHAEILAPGSRAYLPVECRSRRVQFDQ